MVQGQDRVHPSSHLRNVSKVKFEIKTFKAVEYFSETFKSFFSFFPNCKQVTFLYKLIFGFHSKFSVKHRTKDDLKTLMEQINQQSQGMIYVFINNSS